MDDEDCLRNRLERAEKELKAANLQVGEQQKEIESYKRQLQEWYGKLQGTDALLAESNRLLSEEQKKADGLLAHLGALRAVLIIDGGEKLAPEIRKALWLDHDVALDLQRVRREVVEAAKELKAKQRWPYLDEGGGRLARALDALEKVEAARVEAGMPLETRIIERPKGSTEYYEGGFGSEHRKPAPDLACDECGGDGYVVLDSETCRSCEGSGRKDAPLESVGTCTKCGEILGTLHVCAIKR